MSTMSNMFSRLGTQGPASFFLFMLLSVFLYAWVCYCLCFVCLGGGGSFFSSELVCYKHVFS